MRALLEAHPWIAQHAPHTRLADLPTPVQRLPSASETLGAEIWVKRDDLSAASFAGNKPRKLEFLLGEALKRRSRAVITFGYAGSNHAAATGVHASALQIKPVALLLHQPAHPYVRRNLLVHAGCETELHAYGSKAAIAAGTIGQVARWTAKTRRAPMVIPAGGSSPLGTVGMVNAAFELARQVRAGEMPEPDVVYVACGSAATATGLALGLAATGLRSEVVAVRVAAEQYAGQIRVNKLAERTMRLLRDWDPTFPAVIAPRVRVRSDFYPPGYAHSTPDAEEAIGLLAGAEDLELDVTYTAKAFAALIADARNGTLEGKRALFWLSATSHTPEPGPASALPGAFSRYL